MSSLSRAPAQRTALAWLALLVLGLGLPQLLIVCRGHDGSVQLAFQHDPAECCHGEHGADESRQRVADPDLPHPGLDRAPDCEHEDLAIGMAPTPRPFSAKAPPLQLTHVLPPIPATHPRDTDDRAGPPPATGPPRAAAHLRHVTTTRLLL